VTLRNLKPGTTYYYRAKVTAPGGRTTASQVQSLLTPPTDKKAPKVGTVKAQPRPDGTAAVDWTTNENAASSLLIGTSRKSLDARPGDAGGTSHSVVVTQLKPTTKYYYRVRSVDPSGNVKVWPSLGQAPASFTSSALGVADFTETQLRTGKASGTTVTAAGVTLASGKASGSFESRVLDAQQLVEWKTLSLQASRPAGTTLRVSVRTGSTSTPDPSWTAWKSVKQGGKVNAGSRFVQYRVELIRSAAGKSPVLKGVGITSNGKPLEEHSEK
jgi:hypothetical protein